MKHMTTSVCKAKKKLFGQKKQRLKHECGNKSHVWGGQLLCEDNLVGFTNWSKMMCLHQTDILNSKRQGTPLFFVSGIFKDIVTKCDTCVYHCNLPASAHVYRIIN
jgi:hypothetical protein